MSDGSNISSELPNMAITAKMVVVTLQLPVNLKIYILSNWTFGRCRMGDAVWRRRLGDRMVGRCHLGDRTFGRWDIWAMPFGRRDVWATGRLGDGTYGRRDVWAMGRLGETFGRFLS